MTITSLNRELTAALRQLGEVDPAAVRGIQDQWETACEANTWADDDHAYVDELQRLLDLARTLLDG